MAFIMVRILCQLRSGKAQCFMKNFLKFGKWWDEKNLKTQCWNSKKCRTKIIISKKKSTFSHNDRNCWPFSLLRNRQKQKKTTENPKTTNQHRLILQGEGFCDDGECWAAKTTPKKSIFLFLLQQWVFFEGWNVSKLLIFFNIFFCFVFGIKPSTFGDFGWYSNYWNQFFFWCWTWRFIAFALNPKRPWVWKKPPGHHFLRP